MARIEGTSWMRRRGRMAGKAFIVNRGTLQLYTWFDVIARVLASSAVMILGLWSF